MIGKSAFLKLSQLFFNQVNTKNVIMGWTWNCIETQSSIKTLTKSDSFSSLKGKKENRKYAVSLIGTQPQKEQNSVTFTFKIYSLMIKYKESSKFSFYPSVESVKLRGKTKFTWNVEKSLIERFKEYSSGEYHDSPIFDNLCIVCHQMDLKINCMDNL